MAKLPVKKSPAKIPVGDYIREYVRLSDEIKRLQERKDSIGKTLKELAAERGETDDKGSSYFERDNYIVGNVARKSISFNIEKAVKFFRRKGFPECITTQEVINSDAVEELLDCGEITVEDLEKITETKVSYSVLVKPVETPTNDEVEEHEVKPKKTLLRGKRA